MVNRGEIYGIDPATFKEIQARQPVAISPFIRARTDAGDYPREALAQFYPDVRELESSMAFRVDPTGERGHLVDTAPTVIQTYDNRANILTTHACLVMCRFCFRGDSVGRPDPDRKDKLDQAVDFLREHSQIDDVLLSGGDPLALPNSKFIPFARALTEIPSVKKVRIDSRAVSVAPNRINDELLEFMAEEGRHENGTSKFSYFAHMNHPADLEHQEVFDAIGKLQRAGIRVYNQAVLLAGVNDDPEVVAKLMETSDQYGIVPYDLYILDRVQGAAHFEVPDEKVMEIYLRLHELSGSAVPRLTYVSPVTNRKVRTVSNDPEELQRFLAKRKEALDYA